MQLDLPKDPQILQRACQDVQQSFEIIADFERRRNKRLSVVRTGPSRILTENLQSLLAALEHPLSQARISALFNLQNEWPQLEELVLRCFHLAFHDEEQTVRGVALYVLHGFHGWINDATGVLTRIVCPDLELDDQNACDVLARSDRVAVACTLETRQEWEALIGARTKDMLRSRELTDESLEDPDANVRDVALRMMLVEWKPTPHAASIAEARIYDPNERIQRVAIGVLQKYYAGRGDKRIAGLLAKLVADESQINIVRYFAYHAVLDLCGKPKHLWPIVFLSLMPEDFVPRRHVDWGLINSLLKESGK